MNPRQRRGALLLVLAAIGAIVVFISIVGYVQSVRAEVGLKVQVLRVKQNVAAYSPLDSSAVELVSVPQKWTPKTMLSNTQDLSGKVAAADIPAGTYLEQGMLVDAPVLKEGEREIAIMIDAETGVAGKVHPGMYVDIYAAYQNQQANGQQACAARIVKSAQVLQIGQQTTQKGAGSNSSTTTQVVPITFALSAVDSLKLTREESFATKIRLALIGGTSGPDGVQLNPVCQTQAAK
jgi:pilus assembly protein CpaB